MPADDQIIKTSFRIPRTVHAEVERAAEEAGLTVNGEVVFRLKHDPREESAKAILAHIDARDAAVVEAMKKQIAALWGALDRANLTLEHVASAMAQVPPDGSAAALKREVEFARELINALGAHR